MSRDLTRRELLLWGLGFGAAGIVAAGSGVAFGRRKEIMQWLGLSEPDKIMLVADKDAGTAKETKPKQAITEVTPANLTDIIERSNKTPIFMKIYADSCPPCRAMAPAYEEVAGSYYPGEVLFTQYKRTYDQEGQAPELPIIKEWGIAGAPKIVVVYKGKNVYALGGVSLVPMRGEDGAEQFHIMVEDILREHCPRQLVNLKESNFRQYLGMDRITVVDLYAPWCGPCGPIKKVFEGLAEEYDPEKVLFAKYNIDLKLPLSKEWDIGSIPHIAVVCKGNLVGPLIPPKDLYKVWKDIPEEEPEKRKEILKGLLETHLAAYSSSCR